MNSHYISGTKEALTFVAILRRIDPQLVYDSFYDEIPTARSQLSEIFPTLVQHHGKMNCLKKNCTTFSLVAG